ncbi:MAG TPA: two-component regulator propeller domain-containing protein [Bacteroidales bacterium]|nr:two-component regulator propeller domain-containing protein [Bacteroidales bacterium]HPS16830.1 two-component regulator propeller domain-containing protein [Bacteroidales bacterium]
MFKIKNIYLLIISVLALNNTTLSQGVGIGEWREHLPYNNCISITEGNGKIFCATKYSVFSYDKSDNSIQRISKINYLSDIGVSRVKYHNGLNLLLVTYTNGNIDLIDNNGLTTNISDIKRKPITGNKTINNILFIDNFAYLACGFGIVVLDLAKKEIKDTYYIAEGGFQIKVFDLTTDGSKIYAATESGLYEADLSCPYLSNYSYWTKHTEMPHPDGIFNTVAYFHGTLYINLYGNAYNDDTLYIYKNGIWNCYDPTYTSNRYELNVKDNIMLVIEEGDIDQLDTNGINISRIYTYNSTSIPNAPSPRDAIFDNEINNVVWIADANVGIVRNEGVWTSTNFQPNGPKTTNAWDISVENSNLWVAPGGLDGAWNNVYNGDGLFSFIDENWATHNRDNTPGLDTIYDIVCVAVNPSNSSQVFAGSWSKGLLEFNNQTLTNVYDSTNSTLKCNYRTGVAGIIFDEDNNLWVTNSAVNTALNVRMNNGTWKGFNFSGFYSNSEVGDLAIDKQNRKWIILPRNNGMLVFDDNNTITNSADDHIKRISNSTGNGGLPSNEIFSIAVDRDGEIWVGTDKGIAVFYNPENVFTGSNFDAQQIMVDQDGYIQPLLGSESVKVIAVDGSNKKWIGTDRAGVFLVSADGTKEFEHFTTENSPLFSNTINTIAIDHKTGEVFFGTDKGIISYKGYATDSVEKNGVVVYPNPVKENYTGYIGIKGLALNSNVKITDISGTLIYQTTAEGGQAIWNGLNFEGKKAKTGIYLVFASNEDGSVTTVAKIMIIN